MDPVPCSAADPEAAGTPAVSRRLDARRNREAVLAAAEQLFTEHGWDVAMQDVAASAEVGVGTVYRHFPSKQVLLGAQLARRFDMATAQVEELHTDRGRPFELLERALWIGATVVASHPLCRLVTPGAGERAWEHAAPARERFDEALRPLFEGAHLDGTLRDDAAPEDVGLLMAAVCATVDDARPQRWQHVLHIITDGLRAR